MSGGVGGLGFEALRTKGRATFCRGDVLYCSYHIRVMACGIEDAAPRAESRKIHSNTLPRMARPNDTVPSIARQKVSRLQLFQKCHKWGNVEFRSASWSPLGRAVHAKASEQQAITVYSTHYTSR